MFQSLAEFLKQSSEAVEPAEPVETAETAEPVEPIASEDGAQDIDWSASLEESINSVWGNDSNTDGVVENFEESEDDTDSDADVDDEDESEWDDFEELDDIEEDDVDEDDGSEDESAVGTGANVVDSDADDTEGLWDALLKSFGEPVGEEKKEEPSSSANTDELERLKQAVEALVSWQSAVQEYLQTSIEAENIRTVAQQLASLGVILPDEQIQEIARTSQQLGIPPSILLKAKAYDYTMQTMQQQGQTPFPFMVNASSAQSVSSKSSLIPNARPFRPEEPQTQRVGFTRLQDFLRQIGMSE